MVMKHTSSDKGVPESGLSGSGCDETQQSRVGEECGSERKTSRITRQWEAGACRVSVSP